MHRQLFVELSPAEQEQFIRELQERRLRVVHAHENLVAMRKQAQDERTSKLVEQQCRMMEKEIAAVTKALEKAEARAAKIAALRAMIEAEAYEDGGQAMDEGT